mmetsp:Transcript_51135/g.102167  ORF Transcript_51135/g.102167 Transcript_51135/m.102167 type:complete len:275 (-) Transcript_51135:1246-2070(-)
MHHRRRCWGRRSSGGLLEAKRTDEGDERDEDHGEKGDDDQEQIENALRVRLPLVLLRANILRQTKRSRRRQDRQRRHQRLSCRRHRPLVWSDRRRSGHDVGAGFFAAEDQLLCDGSRSHGVLVGGATQRNPDFDRQLVRVRSRRGAEFGAKHIELLDGTHHPEQVHLGPAGVEQLHGDGNHRRDSDAASDQHHSRLVEQRGCQVVTVESIKAHAERFRLDGVQHLVRPVAERLDVKREQLPFALVRCRCDGKRMPLQRGGRRHVDLHVLSCGVA